MSEQQWRPTHEIRRPEKSPVRVMLCAINADDTGAPGYTLEEWESEIAADYERTADGRWLFQGESFAGEVSHA